MDAEFVMFLVISGTMLHSPARTPYNLKTTNNKIHLALQWCVNTQTHAKMKSLAENNTVTTWSWCLSSSWQHTRSRTLPPNHWIQLVYQLHDKMRFDTMSTCSWTWPLQSHCAKRQLAAKNAVAISLWKSHCRWLHRNALMSIRNVKYALEVYKRQEWLKVRRWSMPIRRPMIANDK